MRLAWQLILERFNGNLRARRPIFQTVLFWDVFRSLFDPRRPPSLSTFFTNHIAGVMHRFWNHVYPEDFPDQRKPNPRIHHRTMEFAFSVLDEMMADVLKWQKLNPELTVILLSSMGQAAVYRTDHEGIETVVKSLPHLMSSVGLQPTEYTELLAMVPQGGCPPLR